MSSKHLTLSPPWISFYREIEALFKDDPGIKIKYDEETQTIRLYVESAVKAEALTALLPSERTFGNITVHVEIVPANDGEQSKIDLFKAAFYGNNAFRFTRTVRDVFSNPVSYVVFRNKVVQYYNDDMSDLNGLCSTLYEDIAEDVFENHEGVFFSTDNDVCF